MRKNLYKGDRVVIRRDLNRGAKYSAWCAASMMKYAGMEATITEEFSYSSSKTFHINIDKYNFMWSADMFEDDVHDECDAATEEDLLTLLGGLQHG